jgi:chemotaxis protein CheX
MQEYIHPFVRVCTNVFREFVKCDLAAERPYFSTRESITNWDVSGVIGLTGEARGSIVMSMKSSLAFKLTNRLTGVQHDSLDRDVIDAVGEIVNIIAGNAKQELESTFKLVISLPTIIKGLEHTIVWVNDKTRVICIPFKIFDGEIFCLSIAIEKTEEKKHLMSV